HVTGVQTCALPISLEAGLRPDRHHLASTGLRRIWACLDSSVQQGDGGRGVLAALGQFFEFVDRVDVVAHGDVGDALQDELDHDGHAEFLDPGAGLGDGGLDLFDRLHADGLAAQAFGDLDVVHAVAVGFRRIDVVEGQLHAVVHVEAALRLADQPQVGIIDHNVDVGQVELRAHGQFLDHELEVVVAGQGDDFVAGVRGHHAQRGGHRPA